MRSLSVTPSDRNSAGTWISPHSLERSRREIDSTGGAFRASVENFTSDPGSSFVRDEDIFTTERVHVWIPVWARGVKVGGGEGHHHVAILACNTTCSHTGIKISSLSSKGSATTGRGFHRVVSGNRRRSGG